MRRRRLSLAVLTGVSHGLGVAKASNVGKTVCDAHSRARVLDLSDQILGDTLNLQVIKIDPKNKRIILSVSAYLNGVDEAENEAFHERFPVRERPTPPEDSAEAVPRRYRGGEAGKRDSGCGRCSVVGADSI